ncbi:MAG TPA: glycosyl transferase family 1 [Verrucomicrobia subdivision 3 bacterium]|nr:glycosyl transferase family 1 [Limisphaerales bacterium]
MLKVTFCAYDSPGDFSGPTVWLRRLLPALRNHDIEPRCLFLTWNGIGPTVVALRAQGFDCQATPCSGFTPDRVHWLLDHLRENSPDVFVPNHVVPGYYAARWVKSAGIETVGVLYSDDGLYRGIQEQFILGSRHNRISAVVCVSQHLQQQVLGSEPPATTSFCIPCGVPLPVVPGKIQRDGLEQLRSAHAVVDEAVNVAVPFRRRAFLDGTPLRLSYVGRLVEEAKQVSALARAFCRAVREVENTEAVIYGSGPAHSSVTRILAEERRGLPVRLIGRFQGNIQERLLEADVIVLLSDYEGLPIALLEAMACGCVPVCLRTHSGIPELIEDGVTGLLVDDRGDSFVNAIRRLRNEPGLWQRLSQAARTKIENGYSIQTCARQWAELLHSLHDNCGLKRPIYIPRRIKLPSPHPSFRGQDPRPCPPPFPVRFYRRSRIFAGRIRRQLLGQPIP